ncbi:MAG TPA: HAD-IC family P-type ATPase [Acidimicrobiales bacterium]|nr:HAD-IC family P-type ATPase [Acidimicrobiales bacterium]
MVTELSPAWIDRGLTLSEVARRAEARGVSAVEETTSQTWAQILRRNAITRLNFLLLALGGATLVTGSAPDATFLGIALINTVVGAVQEARAKRTLDALAVVNAPRARVIRDGLSSEISPEEVVVDDLLDLRPGDQLTADGVVVADQGEVDESLATGESEPVAKKAGDDLISGTWLVAGSLKARVVRVGAEAYAYRLAEQARRFSLSSSELMRGINQVLRWLTWLMVVIAPILFARELQSQPWRVAIRLAVAGLVGMIPEGLVLLTTLAFLAAALRLGRRQVLVQELPAVETLARVDSLCVDKTGTLTEGAVSFAGLWSDGSGRGEMEKALAGLSADRSANATMLAIRDAVTSGDQWAVAGRIPFSSSRKWSAASFDGHGTWVLGAPEMIHADDPRRVRERARDLAEQGSRVLVVATSPDPLSDSDLPDTLTLVGLVELREHARAAVQQTLSYFADQGVTVRVISGDSPATVRSLAQRVGLPGADLAVDARQLPSEPTAFGDQVEENRIFGRVTPEQKREMVHSLQAREHTVAMTGDGVNDVLALKDADLGVAMGSGAAVTRAVAQVVILDDDFDVLPSVVAEGRRVLANIENVASLFLVKNVYSLILSVAVSITGWPYPFLPRHLTLISALGIGIPGFFLALAPNQRRFRPGFLRRALAFSILAGSLTAAAVLLTYAGAREEGLSGDAARTAAIIVTVVVTLWVLAIVSRPITMPRAALLLAMAGLFVASYFTPGVDSFFSMQHRPSLQILVQALAFGAAAAAAIDVLSRTPLMQRWTEREASHHRGDAREAVPPRLQRRD